MERHNGMQQLPLHNMQQRDTANNSRHVSSASGKLAKSNYTSEQPQWGQKKLEFISLASLSPVLTSIGEGSSHRQLISLHFLLHLQHLIKDRDPKVGSLRLLSLNLKSLRGLACEA